MNRTSVTCSGLSYSRYSLIILNMLYISMAQIPYTNISIFWIYQMMNSHLLNQQSIRLLSCTGASVNSGSARHSSTLVAHLVFYHCSSPNTSLPSHKFLELTSRQALFLSYPPLPQNIICKTSILLRPMSLQIRLVRWDVLIPWLPYMFLNTLLRQICIKHC